MVTMTLKMKTEGAILDEKFGGKIWPMLIEKAVIKSLANIEKEVVQRTPVLAGYLKNSIYTETRGNPIIGGFVGSPGHGMQIDHYLLTMEYGLKPGTYPPIAPIQGWARKRWPGDDWQSIGYAVQKNIGKFGYPGHFMFTDTFRNQGPKIEKLFEKVAEYAAKIGETPIDLAEAMAQRIPEIPEAEVAVTRRRAGATRTRRGRGLTMGKVRGALYGLARRLGDISAVSGISFGGFRGRLYGAARVLGDIQAIRRGRVIQRIGARAAGRLTGRVMGATLPQGPTIGGRIGRRIGGRVLGRRVLRPLRRVIR